MKILITGQKGSGQKEVAQQLIGDAPGLQKSLSGLVLDHTFKTKYFTADCGLWIDEFTSCNEWSEEYSSDAAEEVRDALILFIFTFNGSLPDTSGLIGFVDKLKRPGMCLAVAKDPTLASKETENLWSGLGFELVTVEELEPIVHSALYDCTMGDDASDESNDGESSAAAPRELDDIMKELHDARSSTTMSNEEKKALSERIAAELELL